MTEALQLSFDVACSSEHSFTTWTTRIGRWWPADHTVSHSEDAAVVLQGGVGGRIYERTVDGREHDWGEITAWEPPVRLAYRWHLGRDAADATEVEIRFLPQGPGVTRIGWNTLLPHFLSAAQPGERP